MSQTLQNLAHPFTPHRITGESFEEYSDRRKLAQKAFRWSRNKDYIHKASAMFTQDKEGNVVPAKGLSYVNSDKSAFQERNGHKAAKKALKRVKRDLRRATSAI